MPQVAILNFSLVDSVPRTDGSQVVAGFDANAVGFRLSGCVNPATGRWNIDRIAAGGKITEIQRPGNQDHRSRTER